MKARWYHWLVYRLFRWMWNPLFRANRGYRRGMVEWFLRFDDEHSQLFAERAVELFLDYREYFGLTDDQFPEMQPQGKQCEFEDKFCELICEMRGHQMVPDMCGKPEHWFCTWCNQTQEQVDKQNAT